MQLSPENSPLQTGKTWPEIDQAMQARFGGMGPVTPQSLTKAKSLSGRATYAPLNLAYASGHGWKAYYTNDKDASLFRGGMMICADGAPKAYHQNDARALDYIANAGRPGNWWAIVTDNGRPSGNPVKQKSSDPAPGFYVSTTAMVNASFQISDPRRYIDATRIPYIVLPGGGKYKNFHLNSAPQLGDLAIAYNEKNGIVAGGIFAELGPVDKLGEASIALAKKLGVNADPKRGGSSSRDFRYMVFPNTKLTTMPGVADLRRLPLKRSRIGEVSIASTATSFPRPLPRGACPEHFSPMHPKLVQEPRPPLSR